MNRRTLRRIREVLPYVRTGRPSAYLVKSAEGARESGPGAYISEADITRIPYAELEAAYVKAEDDLQKAYEEIGDLKGELATCSDRAVTFDMQRMAAEEHAKDALALKDYWMKRALRAEAELKDADSALSQAEEQGRWSLPSLGEEPLP